MLNRPEEGQCMTKKKCTLANPSWLEKPGVLGFIIDSYVGVEKMAKGGPPRRVFKWEDVDGNRVKGNAEAFTLHMGLVFGLTLKAENACMVHAILRELDEPAHIRKEGRAKRDKNSLRAGKFRQPGGCSCPA